MTDNNTNNINDEKYLFCIQGDSGGPLVTCDWSSKISLIGVTSFGKLCGSITSGIYTRIYNYVSWIEDIVWSDP